MHDVRALESRRPNSWAEVRGLLQFGAVRILRPRVPSCIYVQPHMRGHFWTQRDVRGIDSWYPDAEPERFGDGWGHVVAEPYARLRRAGMPVTIGPTPPADASVLFATMEELGRWKQDLEPNVVRSLARAAWRCRTVVVIRNDYPLHIEPPRIAALELLPNHAASIVRPGRFIAPFPQRGLIPRDVRRGGRIEVAAIKAYEQNVPDWIDGLRSGLSQLDVDLRVDVTPSSWADFREVDVAICSRKPHATIDQDRTYLRKPPTKLINAWAAGCIPVIAPERPYLSLAIPGVDSVLAETLEEVIDVVRRLRSNGALVADILRAGTFRAREFSAGTVLAQWVDVLEFEQPVSHTCIVREIATQTRRQVLRAVRYRLRN